MSGAQRMQALEQANRDRSGRTAVRRALREGPTRKARLLLAGVLDRNPECLRNAGVWDVMSWCYRMRDLEVQAHLAAAGVGEFRRFGDLTDRQRDVIAGRLRG